MTRGALAALLSIAVLCPLLACATGDNARQAEALQRLTDSRPAWVANDALGKKLWSAAQAFYRDRQYRPAWIDGTEPAPQMVDLLQQLKLSEQHGLDPERYGVTGFTRIVDESQTRFRGTRIDPARVPELDARLTYAYLRYAADLLGWSSSPREVRPDWIAKRPDQDLAASLAEAVSTTDVRKTLEVLAPSHTQYQGLKVALAAEREHPTGHEGQLRMNMERWRWAARDLGDRYILINVPAYQMQVIEGDKPVLAMRVIVGEPESPTPIFSDLMTYVVFSPYWNIPESILRDETLPKVAKDPDYLKRNGIEVVRPRARNKPVDIKSIDWSDEKETKGLVFRQVPGPENALGRVKFIFPNHFSVYLHDTPADALFASQNRALSHGCIRVEDPVALAKYVLRDRTEWTEERIQTAMNATDEQTVKLKSPLPVHIGYWTAWVEPDGKTVTYTADPYQIDAAQTRASRQAE